MRAHLIDPFTKTVTEVDYDGNYKSIYSLIGASTIDVVRWADNVVLYVDDEGLLKETDQEYFRIHNSENTFAGKALVTGLDGEGDDIACPWSLDRVRGLVQFPSLKLVEWTKTKVSEGEDGVFRVFGARPIFEEK